MISILGILLLALLFAGYEVPVLRNKQWKRELRFFLIALAFSAGFSVLYVLDVPIPNPIDGMLVVFQPVAAWINEALGVRGY